MPPAVAAAATGRELAPAALVDEIAAPLALLTSLLLLPLVRLSAAATESGDVLATVSVPLVPDFPAPPSTLLGNPSLPAPSLRPTPSLPRLIPEPPAGGPPPRREDVPPALPPSSGIFEGVAVAVVSAASSLPRVWSCCA